MEEITLPKIETTKEEKDYEVFVIQPLYPGYGHTIGNSLRRVLLSSLEGAAVSSVKIEGVSHQFSILEGIKEDVTEIILNLKKLRLKLHEGESATLTLKVKGAKEVKAKDIKAPASVEIANPDLHIATLDGKKASLSMQMTVARGRGYLPTEVLPEPTEVGVIQVDSLFSSILLVNTKVENTRVGQRTDFNKLTLAIKTDGTITPKEALKKAAEILSRQLEPIKSIAAEKKVKKEAKKKVVKKSVAKKTKKEKKSEKTPKKKRIKKGTAKKSR